VQKKAGNYFYKEDPNGVYHLGWISNVFDDCGTFNVKFAGAMHVNQFTHEHGKHLWGPKGGQRAMETTWKASINKTIKKNTAVKKVPAAGKKATAEEGKADEGKAEEDKAEEDKGEEDKGEEGKGEEGKKRPRGRAPNGMVWGKGKWIKKDEVNEEEQEMVQEVKNKRPRGRAPKGKKWDQITGQWIDIHNGTETNPIGNGSDANLIALE